MKTLLQIFQPPPHHERTAEVNLSVGLVSTRSFPQSKAGPYFVWFFFIIDKNIAADYNSAQTSVVLRAARRRGTELIARGFLSFPYRCALVSALSSLLPINRLTDQ